MAVEVPGRPDAALGFRRRGDRTEVELLPPSETAGADLPPDPRSVTALARALHQLTERPELDGTTIALAADHPADSLDPLAEAVADTAGLTQRRDLLQLRRPLPVPADHPARAGAPDLVVRAFDPSAATGDREAWIRANNRAFHDHPDQGEETEATLAARLAEPWFDPAGFLLADDPTRPGELAGFCWTKVHPATDAEPALGEIYVIGVDPHAQGRGLGPALVLAGLDHLASAGLGTATLFVEADNHGALALYDRLGFTRHARRRVYTP